MKSLILVVIMFFATICSGEAANRTAKQEADLRDYILGIQRIAQEAIQKAKDAESEAADSRGELESIDRALTEANRNTEILQGAINEQANALNSAITERDKARAHDEKTTRQNNTLKNILGAEAAAIAVLLLLWLGVPSLAPPWGLVATIAAPGIVFGLVKLIL